MSVKRMLASPWVSIRGPAEPRRQLLWILDAGFAGMLASPGPRNVDWAGLIRARNDLPFAFAGVRAFAAASARPGCGLAATQTDEAQLARRAIEQAVRLARHLGVPQVVLDPGAVPLLGTVEQEDLAEPGLSWPDTVVGPLLARRKAGLNAALDRVCRALFDLRHQHPDVDFCLTASRSVRAVGDRAGLQAIFEDLSSCQLGYWHDAGLVARRQQVLGDDQGAWLDTFSNSCRGFNLSDANSDGTGLPPGAGGVDYGLLSTYVPRLGKPLPGVVDLDLAVPEPELASVHSCLEKYGL